MSSHDDERRLAKILVVVVAVLCVAYLIGGPGEIGRLAPPTAMP